MLRIGPLKFQEYLIGTVTAHSEIDHVCKQQIGKLCLPGQIVWACALSERVAISAHQSRRGRRFTRWPSRRVIPAQFSIVFAQISLVEWIPSKQARSISGSSQSQAPDQTGTGLATIATMISSKLSQRQTARHVPSRSFLPRLSDRFGLGVRISNAESFFLHSAITLTNAIASAEKYSQTSEQR